MNIRHLSALITAIALSASFTSCGDKDDRSSSKSNVVEAQNIEPSTVETSRSTPSLEVGESATETDWQKLKDDYQNSVLDKDDNSNTDTGIIKHTDRDYDGYYLEDYITVNFTGYEHDSDAEVIVDWEKIANDLGNGITPEILESLFIFRIRDVKEHTEDSSDLVNGDRVNLITEEKNLQDAFKQKYTKELKYIDENLWYYSKTPVIVSGLKTKDFVVDTSDIDKAAIVSLCDKTMEDIKDSSTNGTYSLKNNYGSNIIDYVLEGKEDESIFLGKANYYIVNSYKIEKTYLATRTASSYNEQSASRLPENMVFCIYKISLKCNETGENIDMYYRTEVGNILFENDTMIISKDDVEVQLARNAEEAMPDNKYWEISEVK